MRLLVLVGLFFLSINAQARYDRKEWKHWIDIDGDCQDTRAEVLIMSSPTKIEFKNEKRCAVASGAWEDFYFNEKIYKARDIDIDHVVPLKHAHDHGGAKWSREIKRIFANDPLNLVITNKKYNRQKGSKSILEWMPVDRKYACRYAERWMAVKRKYQLPISEAEIKNTELLKCGT